MKKRNARLTLGLVKSTYTGTIYLTLFEDASPIKFWPYSALNKAGIDVLSELIKGFDLGYEIEFQFPQDVNGERTIVPVEMVIVGEPGGKPQNVLNKKNAVPESKFYKEIMDPDPSILPDENLLGFLERYKEEKGL